MVDIESILPQFFPSVWREENGVHGIDFADGVALGFVNRVGGGYSYLAAEEFEALGLGTKELLHQAQTNLSNLQEALLRTAHPEGSEVAWIESEDNFGAVRMLQPDILAKLFQTLGKPFLFTIPSRDLCLCWSINSPDSLHQKHATEAAEDFEEEEYNLSPQVFVFNGEWPCLPYTPAT